MITTQREETDDLFTGAVITAYRVIPGFKPAEYIVDICWIGEI